MVQQGISNSFLEITILPPFIVKDEGISLDPNCPNVTPQSNDHNHVIL
jgi:hypothetical protein